MTKLRRTDLRLGEERTFTGVIQTLDIQAEPYVDGSTAVLPEDQVRVTMLVDLSEAPLELSVRDAATWENMAAGIEKMRQRFSPEQADYRSAAIAEVASMGEHGREAMWDSWRVDVVDGGVRATSESWGITISMGRGFTLLDLVDAVEVAMKGEQG